MPTHDCSRRGCTRPHSQLRSFLNRRRPPAFEGHAFCSEDCLRNHAVEEFTRRWELELRAEAQRFPRPRIGTILMQTAFVTREQLDEAVRLQSNTRQGRLGQWLLHLGFVNEHQVT